MKELNTNHMKIRPNVHFVKKYDYRNLWKTLKLMLFIIVHKLYVNVN